MVDEEIHPWAKMLAVVDVFDAISMRRPYRTPMPMADALAFLERNAGTHFDAEVVQCWTELMAQAGQRWAAPSVVRELPCHWEKFINPSHINVPSSRRRLFRTPLRTIAIIVQGTTPHAAYIRDLSRVGIGFYSPITLLPRKQVWICLPGRRVLLYRVVRCRRMGSNCYECGAILHGAEA